MRPRSALIALTLATACASARAHDVDVTGYTDGAPAAIPARATVVVLESPNAGNPLLELEVANKVRRALAAAGYRSVPRAEAQVIVTLRYGSERRVQHGESLVISPGSTTEVKDSTGKVIGSATSATTARYEPSASTVQSPWLTLTALAAGGGSGGRPSWIGEATSPHMDLPIRSAVDFLIPAAVEGFGQNHPVRRSRVRDTDAAIVALRSPPAVP